MTDFILGFATGYLSYFAIRWAWHKLQHYRSPILTSEYTNKLDLKLAAVEVLTEAQLDAELDRLDREGRASYDRFRERYG